MAESLNYTHHLNDYEHVPAQLFETETRMEIHRRLGERYTFELWPLLQELGAYIGTIQTMAALAAIVPGADDSDEVKWLEDNLDEALGLVDKVDALCREIGMTPVSESDYENVADCIALMRRDKAAKEAKKGPAGA